MHGNGTLFPFNNLDYFGEIKDHAGSFAKISNILDILCTVLSRIVE